MSKKVKPSLADKIAGILTAAPTNFEPEDDILDATKAPLTFDQDDDHVDNDEEEQILSKFRKQNIDLLADIDNKYAGKKASRKSLKDSDEDSSEFGEETDNDDEESVDEQESEDTKSDQDGFGEEDEEESGSDDYDESESENDGSIYNGDLINEESDTNFKHLNDTNVSSQLKKAVCVRNQMSLWENLLEIRIQLQKSLIISNKMPQNQQFNEFKEQLDPEFSTKVAETKQNVGSVLNKLLTLQELLLKQYPETKKIDEKAKNIDQDNDDEEIPSDTEAENSDLDEESTKKTPTKKRKLADFEKAIGEHHQKYKKYRDNVIQKWNDKTRIAMKGGASSYSILNQIEYNLHNKEKLIKRTQLKRSQYEILGQESAQAESDNTKPAEEYNSEIFDDDDFYHQLLRELIEVKSADVTDPVQLGRQWIQLQSLRSKIKRKIDTKATKGRKIRYAVHSKLVNFMAPIDEQQWTDEAKTELYNSLFGKNQHVCQV